MIHRLKCRPRFFEDVLSGAKRFEVRKDDRGFRTGDVLDLIEWTEEEGESMRNCRVTVTYILRAGDLGPEYPLGAGFVVLGIRP